MNANGILETVHKVMKEYETKYGQRDYYKVCVELAKHFVANYEYTEPGSKEELPIDKSIDMMIDFYQEISPEYLTTINNIIEAGEFKTYNGTDISMVYDTSEYVYGNRYLIAAKTLTPSDNANDAIGLDALQSFAVVINYLVLNMLIKESLIQMNMILLEDKILETIIIQKYQA